MVQTSVAVKPAVVSAVRWRRAVALLAPALLVGLTLLLLGRSEYVKHRYHSLIAFVDIGAHYGQRIGLAQQALTPGGYDGQFNYYLARDPGIIVTCAQSSPSCPLDDLREVRVERILYPMTARLFALGQTEWLPAALLAVNYLAIVLTALLVSLLARARGLSPWLGAAAGLFCGESLSFLRDLADPFGVLWVVLAIYLLDRRRPLFAGLAVAAALLTREQLILTLPFLALPLIAEKRWRALAASTALALTPFVAWQIVLRALYGTWPLLAGDSQAASLVPIPFSGLWQERATGDFKLVVVAVALPLVLAIGIAVAALWRGGVRGVRGVLRDPVPLMALTYCLLLSLTYWFQWADLYGPARLAAPGVILALLASRAVSRPMRVGYAFLLASTTLVALALNARYLL